MAEMAVQGWPSGNAAGLSLLSLFAVTWVLSSVREEHRVANPGVTGSNPAATHSHPNGMAAAVVRNELSYTNLIPIWCGYTVPVKNR